MWPCHLAFPLLQIEQVSQLSALVDAQLDYHRQAVQILEELADKLKRRVREASSRPKREFKPRPREPFELGELEQPNGGFPCAPAPKITGSKPLWKVPGIERGLFTSLTPALLSINSLLIV